MLKYIRDTDDKIWLFSFHVEHKFVADSLKITPKSAGFFLCDGDFATAYGRSETLNIDSMPDDINLCKEEMSK